MHESRLGRVERYIRPFGTFWQRFRLGRYGPYIGTRDNVDVSTFASSGKDDTDPRDLSGAYAAIRAYAAKLYGGGVVFNAGATGTGGDWSLTFTRPSTGMTENVTVVWPSDTPSNGDVLTVLSYAPGLIELEWAAGGGGGGQASIQFQDEGSNLGSAGTADTVDFTGAGVTASRVGNVVTVDVAGVVGSAAQIAFGWNGAGVALTAGQTVRGRATAAMTITSCAVLADIAGSCAVAIWKDTFANFPPTGADSIVGAAPPTLSTADKSLDTTLTGWTTSIAAGDTFLCSITSISGGITDLSVTLGGVRE